MKEKIIKEADEVLDRDELLVYELGYHLLATVAEEDLAKEVSIINSLVSEYGGNIVSEGHPTLRQLAYEIYKRIETKSVKFNKAFFGWVKFEMESGQVEAFAAKIDVLPNVLRSLLIKTVKENTMHTPKAPLFKREVTKEEIVNNPLIEKLPTSEEDIDKSIDDLLVNESPKLSTEN